MDWHGVLGVGPRRDGGSVRPYPPVLDQQHLVAVDRDCLGFPDDQRPGLRWLSLAIAKQAEVAEEGSGVAQRQLQGFRAAGRQRRAGCQRFGRRSAIDPPPIEDSGHRQLIAKGDLEGVAALEVKFGPLQRPDRRGRAARAQREGVGLGLQRQRGASLGKAWHQAISGRGRPHPTRPSVRVDPAGIWGLPSDRCGPFSDVSVLAVTPCPGAVKKGHFFAAEV